MTLYDWNQNGKADISDRVTDFIIFNDMMSSENDDENVANSGSRGLHMCGSTGRKVTSHEKGNDSGELLFNKIFVWTFLLLFTVLLVIALKIAGGILTLLLQWLL